MPQSYKLGHIHLLILQRFIQLLLDKLLHEVYSRKCLQEFYCCFSFRSYFNFTIWSNCQVYWTTKCYSSYEYPGCWCISFSLDSWEKWLDQFNSWANTVSKVWYMCWVFDVIYEYTGLFPFTISWISLWYLQYSSSSVYNSSSYGRWTWNSCSRIKYYRNLLNGGSWNSVSQNTR